MNAFVGVEEMCLKKRRIQNCSAFAIGIFCGVIACVTATLSDYVIVALNVILTFCENGNASGTFYEIEIGTVILILVWLYLLPQPPPRVPPGSFCREILFSGVQVAAFWV